MNTLIDLLLGFVTSENHPIGLAIIAASAMIEYLVPPFPGDTITLLGAVLITAYRWSFTAVFGVVMAGSVAGSMAAFYLGAWLARRRRGRGGQAQQQDQRAAIDHLVARFRRYGPVYLVINRFLPGIRALFFVAAGMAGMRARSVLLYSAISAGLWNLGIIALGSAVGANFDTLVRWVRTYTLAAWVLVGAVIFAFMIRWVHARRQGRRQGQGRAEPPGGGVATRSSRGRVRAGGRARGCTGRPRPRAGR